MTRTPEKKNDFALTAFWEKTAGLARTSRIGRIIHLYFMGIRGLMRSPLTVVLTVTVVSASLLLFSLFALFLENARDILALKGETVALSVYLKENVSDEARNLVAKDIQSAEGVSRVDFIDKERALSEFSKLLGENKGLLEGLKTENPLPASFEVYFRPGEEATKMLRAFAYKIKMRSEVEQVQMRETTLTYLSQLLKLLRTGGVFAILFTFVLTSFIIASTVRLALYLHREEAEVLRLVGAPEWFVKLPFVVEGCIQGACGAVIAVFVSWGLYVLFRETLLSNPLISFLLPVVSFLSLSAIMVVVVSGVIVGIVGSFFALRRSNWRDM